MIFGTGKDIDNIFSNTKNQVRGLCVGRDKVILFFIRPGGFYKDSATIIRSKYKIQYKKIKAAVENTTIRLTSIMVNLSAVVVVVIGPAARGSGGAVRAVRPVRNFATASRQKKFFPSYRQGRNNFPKCLKNTLLILSDVF